MQSKILTISMFFFLLPSLLYAQEEKRTHSFFEDFQPEKTSFDIGIEFAELAQNKFRDLGRDNFTFLIGQRFGKKYQGLFGWRYMIINAQLSDEHIQNENQVAFIEGNRIDLKGSVHAQRISFDFYPYTLGIGFIKKINRHVLQVSPVLNAALGYNEWMFTNTKFEEDYWLRAMTISAGFRLRSVLFGHLFIENPLFDPFLYLWKNRSVKGEIGDTSITRPDHYGLFSWATVGFQIIL
jgi:hypothetical protein